MKNTLCNNCLDLNLRIRMMKCYVWSVLLYNCENWTLKANTIKRLEAFEMWTYRRMLKIPWTTKTRNEDVIRRLGSTQELVKHIKKRKTAYQGHIMCNDKYKLLHLVLERKIEGKKKQGRRRITWLDNILAWTNTNTETILRVAKKRRILQNGLQSPVGDST